MAIVWVRRLDWCSLELLPVSLGERQSRYCFRTWQRIPEASKVLWGYSIVPSWNECDGNIIKSPHIGNRDVLHVTLLSVLSFLLYRSEQLLAILKDFFSSACVVAKYWVSLCNESSIATWKSYEKCAMLRSGLNTELTRNTNIFFWLSSCVLRWVHAPWFGPERNLIGWRSATILWGLLCWSCVWI